MLEDLEKKLKELREEYFPFSLMGLDDQEKVMYMRILGIELDIMALRMAVKTMKNPGIEI